jgi:hypothetical protein
VDDPRQLRELVRFISQFSFLKWESPRLFIEVRDKGELLEIEKMKQEIQEPVQKCLALDGF